MTIADTAFGCYLLKFVVADTFPHKAIFAPEVDKFPKVKNWCKNTLEPVFGDYVKMQKVSPTGF